MTDQAPQLIASAKAVLAANDAGQFTKPALGLYPHQWLWDSCFIAMGLAYYDPHRAATELKSLLRAQWQNGMVPHIIFSADSPYWLGPGFWQTHRSPAAPIGIKTTALTQPPLLSIAALQVADHLETDEAKVFLRQVYPHIVAYHQWLYRERDPNNTGLAVLVHPWESGLDNTPPWLELFAGLPSPLWIATFLKFKLDKLVAKLRPDTAQIPLHQRLSQAESIRLAHRLLRFRMRRYDSRLHLQKSRHLLEDLVFNSILIAANRALFDMATLINEDLPPALNLRMSRSEQALEQLWDEDTKQYYSRSFKTGELVKEPSIATFLPLFSGAISPERAKQLAGLLTDPTQNWPAYPVPTVPLTSKYFDQHHYWQGPTWVNTNWLIIKGLEQYELSAHAQTLRQRTLDMITKGGWHEYFSPLTGEGVGANNFSWTAALYIDLVSSSGAG